jgi:hypothetical protein
MFTKSVQLPFGLRDDPVFKVRLKGHGFIDAQRHISEHIHEITKVARDDHPALSVVRDGFGGKQPVAITHPTVPLWHSLCSAMVW